VSGDEIEKPEVPKIEEVLLKTMDASAFTESSIVSSEPLEKSVPLPIDKKFSSMKDVPQPANIPELQKESVGGQKTAPILSEPRSTNYESTSRSAADVSPPFPISPTSGEVAEMQRLFAEGPKGVSSSEQYVTFKENQPSHAEIQKKLYGASPETTPFKPPTHRGNILSSYFLQTRVPPHDWEMVQRMPVNAFLQNTLGRGAFVQESKPLVQLSRIFVEVGKPPYNVMPRPLETTEVFIKRAFSAITEASDKGENTDIIRRYLEDISRPRR
jgi:hypothetical protein